eukprot:GHVP01066916.1.p1 GENE.GHVP01066916.1~~GHVP01066916.1.p1  ORF type:complete len:251 (-),score=13.43 GHVP01066916.1:79-831(-)
MLRGYETEIFNLWNIAMLVCCIALLKMGNFFAIRKLSDFLHVENYVRWTAIATTTFGLILLVNVITYIWNRAIWKSRGRNYKNLKWLTASLIVLGFFFVLGSVGIMNSLKEAWAKELWQSTGHSTDLSRFITQYITQAVIFDMMYKTIHYISPNNKSVVLDILYFRVRIIVFSITSLSLQCLILPIICFWRITYRWNGRSRIILPPFGVDASKCDNVVLEDHTLFPFKAMDIEEVESMNLLERVEDGISK